MIKAKLNERSEYDVLSVGLRRASETPVSMTLPRPSTVVASTARHPSALLGLPNELLMHIAGSTGKQSEGINLSWRRVSKHMKVIADDQMSSRQRFLTEYAQTLSASGYGRTSVQDLLDLNPTQQSFALTNGPTLRATAGYNGFTINDLAEYIPAVQNFALTHGPTLHATAGYNGYDINGLANLLPAYQQFALANGAALHARSGYDGESINF
ncbi:hypothetical protein ACFQDN_22405 [Pseudomonas asuensis]